MTKENCEQFNAQPVLEKLEAMIERGNSRYIRDVYDELSIFDWWPERLTITHMKQMRAFLREAIKLGYTGYVCFKVGARGCANGMWAAKEPTTDGYSPKCDTIYRSFTPDYTYYAAKKDGTWYPQRDEWNAVKTTKALENLLAELYN